MEEIPVLDVRNVSVSFSQYSGGLYKRELEVIRDLSVRLYPKEVVAVVGASGSGKSLLAHGILGLLPYNATRGGQIFYRGQELTTDRIRRLRGKEIVLVPQGVSYLDPLMRVEPQLCKGSRKSQVRKAAADTLTRFGLGPETGRLYPFELSGGMARRVLISTAVMESPRLVVADEPTPGLHVSVARRVLGHFRELADGGAAVLLITHDLELAAEVADRVVVFYAGTTLEEARAADFTAETTLRHPYTRALWRAMPRNGFRPIAGMQPYAGQTPRGCPFRGSCSWADGDCGGEIPYRAVNGGFVRCCKEDGHGITG